MKCVVYGIGSSYLREVVETLRRRGIEVAAFVNNQPGSPHPEGLSPVVPAAELDPGLLQLPVLLPLTMPANRRKIAAEAGARGFTKYLTLVDPLAVVASDCRLGEGLLVNAGSVIGARCDFGRFVLVNRSASIAHDVMLGDFATIGPGAVLGGQCKVEAGAFVGIGAVVAPGVTVGRDAVVGAGAVAVRDVPAHCTVFGNPARVIRQGRDAP